MGVSEIYYELVRRDPLLVSYWRLNDPAGATVAVDWSSHNSLPGSYVGTPGYGGPPLIQADKSAESLVCSGDDSVSVPDIAQLRVIGNVSIEAWVVPYAGAQSATIVSKTIGGIASPYSLALVNGVLVFSVGNGSTAASCSGPSVPVGIPSMVMGTLFRGTLSTYLNGRLQITSGIGLQTQADGAQPLVIGSSFNGLIAEVALYNGALSALHCARHFAVGQQVFSDPSHFVSVDPPVIA